MTQKQMQYFEKAYETGNIALAAEALFVSRSVISRSIQELEEEFGMVFFERSKQGVVPTQAGRMLHSMILQIFSSYSSLSRRFQEMRDPEARRKLRIGLTPTNARAVCRLLFGPFLEKHPNVELEILERENDATLPLLSSGQADLIVCPGSLASYAAYESLPLYHVQIVLAVAASNPLSQKSILSVMDLVDCPLGFLSIPIPSAERVIDSSFAAIGRAPDIVIRTSDLLLLKDLTERGNLAAVMPNDLIRGWSGVVGVPLDFMSHDSAHHLVWSSAAPLSSAGSDLVAFMRDYFAAHPGSPVLAEAPTTPAPASGAFRSDALPPDFFADLLDLPSCKSRGYCDNCGRCEH